MKNDGLLWVNPDFQAAYFDIENNPPHRATQGSAEEWLWMGQFRSDKQREHEQASARADRLLLEKF